MAGGQENMEIANEEVIDDANQHHEDGIDIGPAQKAEFLPPIGELVNETWVNPEDTIVEHYKMLSSETARKRPSRPIVRLTHHLPGSKFEWRAKTRKAMNAYQSGKKGFMTFVELPESPQIEQKEKRYKEIEQLLLQAKRLPEQKDLERNERKGYQMPIKGFMLEEECDCNQATLSKIRMDDNELVTNGLFWVMKEPVNSVHWRAIWGLTPQIGRELPGTNSDRVSKATYNAKLLNDHKDYVTPCAPHIAEIYHKATMARVPMHAMSLDFGKMPIIKPLLASGDEELVFQGTEKNLANLWKFMDKLNVEQRYSLHPVTMKILQRLLNTGDLREIDCSAKPTMLKPSEWLDNLPLTEPRLLALKNATLPPAHIMLLMTIANMGWINLEMFREIQVKWTRHFQFDKLREYFEYTVIVHIFLMNMLHEVLDCTQNEMLNWALIRHTFKAAVGYVSMPLNLRPLVEYICNQEIHAEHEIAPPLENMHEANQYAGIGEGQIQTVALLQNLLIGMQKIQWHHAMCMQSMMKANAVAFNMHDMGFMNSVYEVNDIVYTALVQAKERGSLGGFKLLIQRRLEWLTPNLDANVAARKMPYMHWNERQYRINCQYEEFDDSMWNMTPGHWWKGTESEFLMEKKRSQREKVYGQVDPTTLTLEVSAVAVRNEDEAYSSGEEYEQAMKNSENAPIEPQARTWLRHRVAQANPTPRDREIYERIKLVELQLGDYAIADIGYAQEKIENHKGTETSSPKLIFLSTEQYNILINHMIDYRDKVTKLVKYYDDMMDLTQDLSDTFDIFNTKFVEIASLQKEIMLYFLPTAQKKTSESTHLLKLVSPLVVERNGKPTIIDWDSWLLKRRVQGKWINTKAKPVGDEYSMKVQESFTMLSQDYTLRRVEKGSFELYRKTVIENMGKVLFKNRGFYDPKSKDEPTVCKDCGVDILMIPHRQNCWTKNTQLPKAIIQARENRGETQDEKTLAKHLSSMNAHRNEEVMEFMKNNEISEETLKALAVKGHPEARRLMLNTQAGRLLFNQSMPGPGERPLGLSAGSKRPFGASANKFAPLIRFRDDRDPRKLEKEFSKHTVDERYDSDDEDDKPGPSGLQADKSQSDPRTQSQTSSIADTEEEGETDDAMSGGSFQVTRSKRQKRDMKKIMNSPYRGGWYRGRGRGRGGGGFGASSY